MEGDDELAIFVPGGGACPVQYDASYGGVDYYVRYRHGWLTVDDETHDLELFCQQLSDDDDDGYWSDGETNVYLRLIAAAIRSGDWRSLVLPDKRAVATHPYHEPGPLPRYHVPLCEGEHVHTSACYSSWTLSARELIAWERDHPGRPRSSKP